MGCGAGTQRGGQKKDAGEGGQKKDAGEGKGLDREREKEKALSKEANKDFQQTMAFLSKVPLFKCLPKDEHPLLASSCKHVVFQKGMTIIKQGATGSEFFIIKSGDAAVMASSDGAAPVKIVTLKCGDYFGESALLRDEPRTATIVAESELVALKITRELFKELGLTEKLMFANRKAVCAGAGGRTLATKPPSPKTEQEKALIAEALRKNENLQTMVTLDDSRIESITQVAWKETVQTGTDLITEGDLQADYFYIVQEGSFEIFVLDQSSEVQAQSAEGAISKGESKSVSTMTKGGSFGELALLYLVPRAATVKAKEDSIVWVIDRVSFKNIMMKVSDEKISEYATYLSHVQVLEPLLNEERIAVAKALTEMHFLKDEVILQEGEQGSTFYILYEGEVVCSKGGQEQVRLTASKSRNKAETFGERALLNNEARAATVSVVSETAKALALDRDSFNMLLGPLEDIIKRAEEFSAQGKTRGSMIGAGNKSKAYSDDRPKQRILRKDLAKVGLLGCGGFGSVELYEHRTTKETYAMKALSKGFVVKTSMQESVMNEKNILMMTNSPFIITLFETFNGTQTLYFLLEPALGGELYATYNRKGLHGSERHAKFYVAGVIEGFAHLHERRIIYRDLKPENLLLNEKGMLKITDMGLAKFVIGKTYTTCGTPDYFAPELIASTGHTNAVDWWTLGILIFELMSGHPPFESAYPMQTYSKIMKGIIKVPFPPKCTGTTGELIKSLLKKEPSERLPMRTGGISNLRNHPWLQQGFDWTAFQAQTLEPPYKPVVKSKKDIANFSVRKEDMPKQYDYRDDGSGWDSDFAT